MPKSIFKGFEVNPKKKAPIVDQGKIVFNKITDREFNAKLVNAIRCSSDVSQLLLNIINANNTDCVEVNACVNAQLGLPNAGSLTNFVPAVISAYESHIAAGGADPEFCGEVLACLQTASPAIVDAVAVLINNALATSPNPLLSNLCTYINDCIDSGLLVVSADAGNQITTGTDGGAYLSSIDAINVNYDNTTSGLTSTNVQDAIDEMIANNDIALYEVGTDNGIIYTYIDGSTKSLKTGHTETITPTANTPYTITHNLNSTRIHIEARDVASNRMVDVEFSNKTLNTVDVTSTTIDDLEITIKI